MIPIQNDQQFLSWIRRNAVISTLRKEFTAGVPITAGTGVYMSTDGKVYPYITAHQDTYIGIAENSTAVNCAFIVVLQGYLNVPSSGWQAGTVYSMTSGGSISSGAGDFKVAIGVETNGIVIYNWATGGSSTVDDGYAKVLMLMGG
jgi:hypothetical protein